MSTAQKINRAVSKSHEPTLVRENTAASNIVRKTLRMAETIEKYPSPVKKKMA
ncbi:hypothetical protein [Dyadobacter sandarakinus]|uniref:Uncharacterized protein n=1 Tax=Dyadobacter sandarakinus TaxID=2747268 RepID=A0ABX7IAV0_9BACT|nr:hypothetical protein [Dyadobacter sandarakinus]QRR02061.1 hypothetical protein HWI92_14665 [Dyadobacter sandarakinus]